MDTIIIACGSLKKQVEAVLEENERPEVVYLPPVLHMFPAKLRVALEGLLSSLEDVYSRVVLLYGKCVPGIDRMVVKHGAVRVPGELCYEMLVGKERFREIITKAAGTYFLTDDLCRNFERLVIEPLQWRNYPEIKEKMLKNYRRVVFLDSIARGSLDSRAREIASYLNLPLEIERLDLINFARVLRCTLSNPEKGNINSNANKESVDQPPP